jgi:type I restriction enzyme S subunit
LEGSNSNVQNIHYGDVLIKYGSIVDVESDDIPSIVKGKESKGTPYLRDGDVIIADTAEDEAVGKCCEIININGAKVESGLHTIPCRPLAPFVPMYLGYYMNSQYYHKQLFPLMQGVKVLSISKSNIGKTHLSAPSSHFEQKKIVKMLHLIDMRISKQQRIIEVLKKYKRGLISKLLKQKLVLSCEGEKWEEVSLSDVADGFEYGMNAAATAFDGEHKYIRITDIDEAHTYSDRDPVSPSGILEKKYRVRENDILFARTGASVGKSYLYRKNHGDLFFAGFLIRIHIKEGVDSGYVFLNTLMEDYDKWVLLESARSGQPGINAEQYRRYRFKLPPLKIQTQISEIAQKIDGQINRENQCLRLLHKLRDGMLQQLFI